MAKKKQQEKAKKRLLHDLKSETKESIGAVFAFLAGAIAIFAWFGKAGRFGTVFFRMMETLLGEGYLLLPTSFFLLGFAFLFSMQRRFFLSAFVGGILFLVSALGLVELLFEEGAGGIVGFIVSSPLLRFFDVLVSGTILSAFFIISLLITFNIPLRRRKEALVKQAEVMLRDQSPILSQESISAPPSVEIQATPSEAESLTQVIQGREEKETSALDRMPSNTRFKKDASYLFPPSSLLENDRGTPSSGDIKANANIIQRTLQHFGIPVEMGEVSVGPSITQYTLKPAQGIKLSRITSLQNDLALALAAHPLRIEAPIPGKSLLGIEIPNRSIALVGLRSLLGEQAYLKGDNLVFVLGRDVKGEAVFVNLGSMPHLLIAGSTGTGKSVSIHVLLTSLLYKNTPDMLRLLLIDPKRVELSLYRDIPHLIHPVITDAKKTIMALRWVVGEMEKRYEVLSDSGSRDLASYNASSADKLPYIIIVIDELADLMAAYQREIESSIVRLAQMARAVGIHLVVSTQRPSVEVITGLIKANITSRIAFQVASQVDSRTILDGAGAEKLLGNGDMLYLSADTAKPRRIQGAFISEKEVKKVTDFIRKQETVSYAEELTEEVFENQLLDDDGDINDELYEQAYATVLEAQKASASYLQRRLRVGYARAARLLDMLEQRGVIGRGEGAKPREILIPKNNEESYD